MQETNWYRTDLIDETEEVVQHQTKQQKEKLDESEGVIFEEYTEKRVKVTKVLVNKEGSKEIGKKEGQYITLTVPSLNIEDHEGMEQLEQSFLKYIDEIHQDIPLTKESKVLVIGLGNRTITPDAIGPLTIDAMQARQLENHVEQFILYAPGVTGQTGFETSEFVHALTEKIRPDLVLAIDALATRGSSRLCKTIQITNTGIHPGSGVGNQRAEISKEVLGVPVTAIGVPTVVDATVIIADAVDKVFRSIATKIQEKDRPSGKLSVTTWTSDTEGEVDLNLVRPIFGEWSTWSKAERRQLFEEVLLSDSQRLIVTPKEVDLWMTKYSTLISNCLFQWIENRVNQF
ncbi:GPR endopeptidase [Ureibacillus sp. FSL K6-8385]|uniref:Germination protease n=1 Tax=Ureibacillus terrenus TaxID=118246 RepID=A0A540V4W8_9BACL|nr:GPR endopeptidase [Ureibacillus terrenus]MED3661507.1 GPR endopeptidase [Ureibacillus terrenus]MED3763974.1 GPR endopeptidase [Ureibacillus terrenus]TQE91805.1 GPR endopeptidase [Ureibacillus terrenus]